MHVVVRQNFVPGISFHAELEVAAPDVGGNAAPHLRRGHMIIKLVATDDCVSQRGEKFARSFEDFGNWINESLVIARLMTFDRRRNWRHDVFGVAVPRKEDFNAGAGGLRGLDEDEFVLMRQDHFPEGTSRTLHKRSPALA